MLELTYDEETGKFRKPIEFTVEFRSKTEKEMFMEFLDTEEFRKSYEEFARKRGEWE